MIKRSNQKIFFLLFVIVFFGCAYEGHDRNNPRIVDAHYLKDNRNIHVVQSGDTIYSIAWRYDLDFQKLALLNNLPPPYRIYAGQKIHTKNIHANSPQKKEYSHKTLPHKTQQLLHEGAHEVDKNKIKNDNTLSLLRIPREEKQIANKKFIFWPAKGKIIKHYSASLGSKGIEIAGKLNDPISAVDRGVVVYSGSGIRGYGKLLIIKHNSILLSAYAYNNKLLVKEGTHVERGQKIALMGLNSKGPALHFEIRKLGKSLNPLLYLPKRYR